MKGYEGWSFSDKSFATALGLSVVWHLCWFSLITVGMNPDKKIVKQKAKIVFLGPVLNNNIFRTLVETKPELSKTVTRKLSEFSGLANIQTKTMERYSRNSVVSLPLGEKSSQAVRGLILGVKAAPDREPSSQGNP